MINLIPLVFFGFSIIMAYKSLYALEKRVEKLEKAARGDKP